MGLLPGQQHGTKFPLGTHRPLPSSCPSAHSNEKTTYVLQSLYLGNKELVNVSLHWFSPSMFIGSTFPVYSSHPWTREACEWRVQMGRSAAKVFENFCFLHHGCFLSVVPPKTEDRRLCYNTQIILAVGGQ